MKSVFKLLLGVLIVIQQFIPMLSLLPSLPAAAAGTVTPNPVGNVETSCPGYLQSILVYKGKSIRVYDKMTASSSNYVKIVHNQSTIDWYNGPNNTFSNPVFNIISDAKPKNISTVYWVYQDITVNNHANDRATVAAQFVYKLMPLIFPNEVTDNKYPILVTTNISPLNQSTQYKKWSWTPVEGVVNNECQNIYVWYCGDGVVDNGTQNFVEGNPSTFDTIKLNGGEQCDDGNTDDTDNCKNNCTINNVPPTCEHELVSPANGEAQSGDVVTIKCGLAGSKITTTQLVVKKSWTVVYTSAIKPGAVSTFTWTANSAGSYTYECKETYTWWNLTCGGPFSVTYTPPQDTGYCNNLVVKANPWNITLVNQSENPANLPATISYTTNSKWNMSCMLIEKVGTQEIVRWTINAPSGIFSYQVNNTNIYRVKCTVNGIMPGENDPVNSCIMDFWLKPNQTPTIDLEIDKKHGNGEQSCETYNSWDIVPFTIVVTNKGNAPATNFTVKDYIPAWFSFVSASNGWVHSNGVVTWTVAWPLNPNQSITLTLNLKANKEGKFTNKTEICNYEESGESQDNDSDPCDMWPSGNPSDDDEDSLCIDIVNPINPTIDIELVKTIVWPTIYNSGDTITFSIIVTNKGNTTATTDVKDYFPINSLTNVTASNGWTIQWNTVTWLGITLAPGQSKTLTVSGKVRYSTLDPDPCNKAEAWNYEKTWWPVDVDSDGWTMWTNGTPGEDDESQICFGVNAPNKDQFYDIEVVKSLLNQKTLFYSGDLVWFKIRVYNNSSVTVPSFKLLDYLPDDMEFVSASHGWVHLGQQMVQWTITNLGPYSEKYVYLTGRVLREWPFQNCVEAFDYDGKSSGMTPRDKDSDPWTFQWSPVEDDESCTYFDVYLTGTPWASCDGLTINPTSGNTPLTVNYVCTGTNAQNYTIQFMQNGVLTTISNNRIGSYTVTNPWLFRFKCYVNGTITSQSCQKDGTAWSNPYIDLTIKKLFADTNSSSHAPFVSGDTITFKLIVGNSGNVAATNFTVKDYLPTSIQYVSSTPNGVATPNGNGTTITWTIPGPLAPGASTEITLVGKILTATWDKNKVEVCDYEEQGEPSDPDSNPCNMGPNGSPSEDDEDMIIRDVVPPTTNTVCNNLVLAPTTGFVPYNVTYTCNATNAQTYTIKLFGGNLWPNGLVVANGQQWSFTMNLTGQYEAHCIVHNNGNQASSAACVQPISGRPSQQPSTWVCYSLNVTPQGWMNPTNVNFSCHGAHSAQYVVNIVWPNGFNQSIVWSTWSLTLTNVGNYSFICSVWGNTSTACSQTVVITGAKPDIEVIKSVTPTMVKTNDMVTYSVQVKNIGAGDAQEFFVTDNMPAGVVYQSWTCAINGVKTWVSCTFNQPNQIYVFFEAGLKSNQITTITYQAKVVATWGKVVNVACADPCNNETTPLTGNNCDDATIMIIDNPTTWNTSYCTAVSVNPTMGTGSMTWTISCSGSWSTYQVLINNNLVTTINNLVSITGITYNHWFNQPWTYTIACKVDGITSSACNQTVVVYATWSTCTNWATNYPSCIVTTWVQCLDLVATPVYGVPGQTVNFSCLSSGGSVYQIYVYKDVIGSSNLVATLYGKSVSYTFANAGKYIAKCVVDGSVDYKYDYYRNHCLDTLTCAYKVRPWGGLCAVKAPLAPFKASYIEPTDRASMPAPIDYCTDTEIATLSCHDNSKLNKFGVVRDRTVCDEMITITWTTQPTNSWSLGNYVRVDSNGNGIQDNGELWLWWVTVRLYSCNGSTVIATTITDSNGYYVFNNLPAGNYQVEFVLPNGYTFTTSNAWSNDTLDSDVAWSRSHCVTLGIWQSDMSIDAGVIYQGWWGWWGPYNPPPFAQCGNGRQEIWEYCDYRASNIAHSNGQYMITNGVYKGKYCTTNCTIIWETDAPACMDIDPPSINEGEYFPFWWNIDNSETNVVSSCSSTTSDAVLKSSMMCYFSIYNGKRGTTDPVIGNIALPCYTDQWFDSQLMSYWKTKSAWSDGRKVVIFDADTTKGIYGEYKIELNKITYKTCNNAATQSYDGRVCQYNFVVGEWYMISKGANISTLKDTSILGYYGFSSNTPRFDLYLRWVQQSLTLNSFDPTRNMSYLSTEFVDKYTKLAQNAGVGVTKVPGKNIYIYEHSVTLRDTDIADLSTIIVKGGNLRLEWTITKNVLYVVPNGTITFWWDANCDQYTNDSLPQIIQGILVAGQWFSSDNYLNTNTSKERCHNGGLRIRWTLIGKWVDSLIEARRVVLNDWFQWASADSKTQHILDGASLMINPNATLWNTLPWADEVATILWVEKK